MRLTSKECEKLFLKNEGFVRERIEEDSGFRHRSCYRILEGKLYFEYEYSDRKHGTLSRGKSKCDDELAIRFAEKHFDLLKPEAEADNQAYQEEKEEKKMPSKIMEDSYATLDPMEICKQIALKSGISVEQMTNKMYRSADIVIARNVFMYLCRMYTPLSYSRIGKLSGCKDQTIVIWGINKIAQQLQSDLMLRIFIKEICHTLQVEALDFEMYDK